LTAQEGFQQQHVAPSRHEKPEDPQYQRTALLRMYACNGAVIDFPMVGLALLADEKQFKVFHKNDYQKIIRGCLELQHHLPWIPW
jgi:hypothetical protein